ncbi:MAG: hypothetical protein R2752_23640 [Vicinamibacterales bacterium]
MTPRPRVTRKAASPARASAAPPARASTAPLAGGRVAEVVLDVEVEHDRVHLVLANCGDAVATEIVVEFSRPIVGPEIGRETIEISQLPVFRQCGVLRPGRMHRIFWDAAPALLANPDRCAPFTATVTWSERGRARQRARYHHDPSIHRVWPRGTD